MAKHIETITLIIAVAVLVSMLSVYKVAGNVDLWTHLRLGQEIWEARAVPDGDPLSYTKAGEAWIYHEWLAAVILFLVDRIGTLSGLIIFKAILISLAFMLVSWPGIRAGIPPFVILIFVAIGVSIARTRFQVRPHLFSFLCLAVLVILVERSESSKDAWFAIPPLFFFWVNVHGGFVNGYLLLVLFVTGSALSQLWQRTARVPDFNTFKAGLIGLSFLVSLINPYHYKIWLSPLQNIFSHSAARELLVTEWQPPAMQQLIGLLGLYVAFSSIAAIYEIMQKRLDRFLPMAAFIVLALRYKRAIPLMVLVTLPSVFRLGQVLFEKMTKWLSGESKRHWAEKLIDIWLLLMIVSIVLMGRVNPRFTPGLGRLDFLYPDCCLDFMRAHPVEGHWYNSTYLGGYLSWKLPAHKIMCDGRNDLFTRINWTRQLSEISHYDFVAAIVGYRDFRKVAFDKANWALVYWDDAAMVYLRKLPSNKALIDQFAFELLHPEIRPDDALSVPSEIGLAEMSHISKTCPDSYRYAFMSGLLLEGEQKWLEASLFFRKIAKQHPNLLPEVYLHLGRCYYNMDEIKNALDAYNRSIRLNPRFAAGYRALSELYLYKLGNAEKAKAYMKKAITLEGR